MGFYSTLCSSEHSGTLPDWFKSKYDNIFLFPTGVMIVSKTEAKLHRNEIYEDYQRALIESGLWDKSEHRAMLLTVIGEDGIISKVTILKNEIK